MNKHFKRDLLLNLFGDLPARKKGDISVVKLNETEYAHCIIESLILDLNGMERAPAFFARPKAAKKRRLPTLLYNHAHCNDYVTGKNEFVHSRDCLQPVSYALELTRLGFNALCIDHWCFGERRGVSELSRFKEMLWKGQVLWGMMVYDSLRAIDYLETRADVSMDRIGTLGLSMGGTMAWWVAALDTRVKVCIDICSLTEFNEFIEQGGLECHGIYYYVPSLLKHFTTADINGLIAPRAHLSIAGIHDRLTPPKGLDRIDALLSKQYAREGAAENWVLERHETGHYETALMRAQVLSFLQTRLR